MLLPHSIPFLLGGKSPNILTGIPMVMVNIVNTEDSKIT